MTKDHSWQVVDLELSKRLEELGYPQESLWWWIDGKIEKDKKSEIEWKAEYDCPDFNATCRQDCSKCKYSSIINHEVYSAPTCAELGKKLPDFISHYKDHNFDSFLAIEKMGNGKFEVKYRYVKDHKIAIPSDIDISLASAMAKMLIHLLEHNLIKVKGK